MQGQNQSSLASIFSVFARSSNPRYVIHKDWTLNKWNVFKLENGVEEFVEAFVELSDAESFCSINNGALAAMINAGAQKGDVK